MIYLSEHDRGAEEDPEAAHQHSNQRSFRLRHQGHHKVHLCQSQDCSAHRPTTQEVPEREDCPADSDFRRSFALIFIVMITKAGRFLLFGGSKFDHNCSFNGSLSRNPRVERLVI